MANKRNYAKELNTLIETFTHEEKRPTLLLHACCAPCSSAVLEKLTAHFKITVLFYNPNIYPEAEYQKREAELKRLISEMPCTKEVALVDLPYVPEEFFTAVRGLEHIPEGGERCFACYKLRMEAAAKYAAEHHFDFFTTTLSISPLKDAQRLNRIGGELSQRFGTPYLFSDFKKKDGYRRSCALSEVYGLYRQDYCGCRFSRDERDRRLNALNVTLKTE